MPNRPLERRAYFVFSKPTESRLSSGRPHKPLPSARADPMRSADLFHVIGRPFVVPAVSHVWHAAGREVADGHPFPSSTHVGELARAVNDTPRPFGLGGISLPGLHDK